MNSETRNIFWACLVCCNVWSATSAQRPANLVLSLVWLLAALWVWRSSHHKP